MQPPIYGHALTEADLTTITNNVTGSLRSRHTKSVARHAELDVGEPLFAAIVGIAEDYAAYRLGFKGKKADDVNASIAAIKRVIDTNFADFLAREAMDAIDGELHKKLGQSGARAVG